MADPLGAEEREQFLAVLTDGSDGELASLTSLCRRLLKLLPHLGASLALMNQGAGQGLAGAFGDFASAAQDLEFVLGEGPGIRAYSDGRPIVVDDVRIADERWPLFGYRAVEIGLRSVCALPLQVGSVRLGVLCLFGDSPEAMTPEDFTSAVLVADLVTHLVLVYQSEASSESLPGALERSDFRAIVHQATGMISAQLDCGVGEALVRLRGRAFAADRSIDEVAEELVMGRTRLDGR
jgi:GAF domain-containing protein